MENLAASNAKRAKIMFTAAVSAGPSIEEGASRAQLGNKVGAEWAWAQTLPSALLAQQSGPGAKPNEKKRKSPSINGPSAPPGSGALIPSQQPTEASTSHALATFRSEENLVTSGNSRLSTALVRKKELEARQEQPAYHPQWRLMRVISGHNGWIRSIAVEPNNQWFATGSGDHMIKIWDLASGELKLSLTGHKATVRGLAISSRHPYLFSAGEDKEVKCWDLETNKVIRKYTGHRSGIYCLALHPTLDVLVSGGRDSVARVWDMRTRSQIHLLAGHTGTVATAACQEADPQVITGSMDQTVRLWDLAAGKTYKTLTQHHKSVRALALHPTQYSFASGSAAGSNVKTWRCPEGTLLNSMQHDAMVNTLSCNADGVLFSGGDNGRLKFFDYDTGVPFQSMDDVVQPGSLQSEAGIFCSAFDQSGTRLITGCADKTLKVYREVA